MPGHPPTAVPVRIRVLAPGAGRVVALRGLHQRVAVGNHPVLGASARRTPAADYQAQNQPHIEGRPVYAGLAAADEFVEQSGYETALITVLVIFDCSPLHLLLTHAPQPSDNIFTVIAELVYV